MSEEKSARHKVIAPSSLHSLSYSYYYKAQRTPPQREKSSGIATPQQNRKPNSPSASKRHSRLLPIAAVLVVLIGASYIFGDNGKDSNQTGVKGASTTQAAVADPGSLTVVVNKSHPLQPKNYAPGDLQTAPIPMRANISDDEAKVSSRMALDLKKLVSDAAAQGINLELESGYRSYAFQVNLYNYYVSIQGKSTADEQSARPGYSEHQTGLAVDLGSSTDTSCNVKECFGTTPAGKWITANAYTYGFIVRYTANDQAVTGYEPESWHLRYIGTDVSTDMHKRGIASLEQLYNITGGTTYKN